METLEKMILALKEMILDGYTPTAEYVVNDQYFELFISVFFKIVVVMVVASIAGKLLSKSVRKFFVLRQATPIPGKMSHQRQETLVTTVQNAISYILKFAVLLAILAILGVDTAALALSAGFVGIAAGLGAQTVIRDIVVGFFIIFEDQFSVGDRVRINANTNLEGEALVIGIRTTMIRTDEGDEIIVPNGSILQVTKMIQSGDLGSNDKVHEIKNRSVKPKIIRLKKEVVRKQRKSYGR